MAITTIAAAPLSAPTPLYRSLFVQVVVALLLGIVLGMAMPDFAITLKMLSDGFLNDRRQRQNPRTKTHQFGPICTTPGNLCLSNDYQSLALSSRHRWPAPA
jgi:hypothetical protein